MPISKLEKLRKLRRMIYSILTDLAEICRKNADLEAELIKTYPFLVEELNPENYQSKFHMLLHLEDIEVNIVPKSLSIRETYSYFYRCTYFIFTFFFFNFFTKLFADARRY